MIRKDFARGFIDNSSYDDAQYVIFGVPYDATCTFQKGARYGPAGIRRAVGNFEQYMFEHRLDLDDVKVHDAGDLVVDGASPDEMFEIVHEYSRTLVGDGKFPILLGGDHGTSPGCATAFDDIAVVGIDAHADYLDHFDGERNSHACAAKRIGERIGRDRVIWVGVRSFAKSEHDNDPKVIDSFKIIENGIDWTLQEIERQLPHDRLYISLDIDGIDPAFAPGTGTIEPFGTSPLDVKRIIDRLSPKLLGFDLVEVSPPIDTGMMTSILAARLVREVIAATYLAGRGAGITR